MKQNYFDIYNQTLSLVGNYGKNNPELMATFSNFHKAALKDGEINSKNKELIALGISIHAKCEGCIATHVHNAIESGASKNEVIETIGVAMLMGGGPSLVHGAKAFSAWNDLMARKELDKSSNISVLNDGGNYNGN